MQCAPPYTTLLPKTASQRVVPQPVAAAGVNLGTGSAKNHTACEQGYDYLLAWCLGCVPYGYMLGGLLLGGGVGGAGAA